MDKDLKLVSQQEVASSGVRFLKPEEQFLLFTEKVNSGN